MSRIRVPTRFAAAVILSGGLAVIASTPARGAADLRIIKMMDQCDPASFNAAGIPCVGKGGVTLDTLLKVLGHSGQMGAWHFTPGEVHLRDGQEFQAVNYGGETHTFTEVDEFGGGFVDQLNQLSGNPVPAPECTTEFNPADFVAPGGATEAEDEEPGVHHYQCCIHPWMRVDVIVR